MVTTARTFNVVCMRHPKYTPNLAPNLSCKVCCKQYVDYVVERQNEIKKSKEFDAAKWMERKTAKVVNASRDELIPVSHQKY
ncbi:MAG: hypothetical protein AB7T49_13510 [Oligoflexales bacterium]